MRLAVSAANVAKTRFSLNKLEEQVSGLKVWLFLYPFQLERFFCFCCERIKKEPKVKTETDVGTQGWQDLDVEQLLGVGRHQVFGRLEEIRRRIRQRILFGKKIVGFDISGRCQRS